MIKLFVSDWDGTLARLMLDKDGHEQFSICRQDGMGFGLLKQNNIKTMVLTGENNNIPLVKRCEKMKVDHVYLGIDNKYEFLKDFCENANIDLSKEVAYIGDDINDLECMKHIWYTAIPNDAVEELQRYSIEGSYIYHRCKRDGGEGAVREFIDYILKLK